MKITFRFALPLVILLIAVPVFAQETEQKKEQKSKGFWSRPVKRTRSAPAQEKDDKDPKSAESKTGSKSKVEETAGARPLQPKTSIWEFGLRLTASNECSGITATFPFPTEWPEQAILEFQQVKTGNIGRMSIKKVGNARQILFRVNRLGKGEVAEALVRMKLEKSWLTNPVDVDQLKFAKKPATKIKTYLRPSPLIESDHKYIRKLASSIEQPEDQSDWKHAEAIYLWVRSLSLIHI